MTQSPAAQASETDCPPPSTFVQDAFTLIRAKDFPAARAAVEKGIALFPDDPFVAHAHVHLSTDSGAHLDGAAFMRTFLTTHDPFDRINVHNAWHLAYLELELGNLDAALDWHRRVVAPTVSPMTFYSAVSLVWSLEARGNGDRALRADWDTLRAAALTMEPDALKDVASAMTFIATDDAASLARLRERLASSEDATAATLVRPLVDGLEAFRQRDYSRAVSLIEPLPLEQLTPYAEQLTVYRDTLRAARQRASAG